MKKYFAFGFFITILFIACIGDDFVDDLVDEALRIINPIDSLALGDTYKFEARFTNNIGMEEARPINWSSSDTGIVSIDNTGLATGISKGNAEIKITAEGAEGTLEDKFAIGVGETTSQPKTSRSGSLKSTSSYELKGTFELSTSINGLVLSLNNDYKASNALPGLYAYLSNNSNSINNAYEVDMVTTFSGAHEYQIDGSVKLTDYKYLVYYCKPFGVKVGHGEFDD